MIKQARADCVARVYIVAVLVRASEGLQSKSERQEKRLIAREEGVLRRKGHRVDEQDDDEDLGKVEILIFLR